MAQEAKTTFSVTPLTDHTNNSHALPPALLTKLIDTTPVKSIVPTTRNIIGVTTSMKLNDAINVLANNRILSAPVFNEDNTCAGILDALTIIDYFSSLQGSEIGISGIPISTPTLSRRGSFDGTQSSLSNDMQQLALETGHLDLSSFKSSEEKFVPSIETLANTSVGDVVKSSKRSFLIPFWIENTLSTLLDLFAIHGVHRVVCITHASEVKTVLSQSDVLNWINTILQSGDFDAFGSQQVQSLGLSKRTLVSIDSKATCQEVLKLMSKQKVSSVAIMDENKKLKGAFEASDLRGVSDFNDLSMNIVAFLQKHHPAGLTPLVVHNTSTLKDVVADMSRDRRHRAWVLNSEGIPVDVLSQTDVMKLLSASYALLKEGDQPAINSRELNGDVTWSQVWRPAASVVQSVDQDPAKFAFKV